MYIRRRATGKPKSRGLVIAKSLVYLSSNNDDKPLKSNSGVHSKQTPWGSAAKIRRAKIKHGMLRSSSQPRREPAQLHGWQLIPLTSKWYLPLAGGNIGQWR
jgi:hypothetical protein